MELLILPGPRTDLFPVTNRKVSLLDKDILDRIQKWAMFSANGELEIEDYYGKKISYRGIKYKGTPERVFWHYFPPFFVHEIPRVLKEIYTECRNRNLEPKEYVEEAAKFLKVMVSRLWREIAETDQRLKGNGFSKENDLKDVSKAIEKSNQSIDKEVKAILLSGNKAEPETIQTVDDIIDLKPNFFGLGVNINALWRWLHRKFKNM